MNIEVGTVLIAIDPCLRGTGVEALVIGRPYTVTVVRENSFFINSELGGGHEFSLYKNSKAYWKMFFILDLKITLPMKKHILSKIKLKTSFHPYTRTDGDSSDVEESLKTERNVVIPLLDSIGEVAGFNIITIDEDSI